MYFRLLLLTLIFCFTLILPASAEKRIAVLPFDIPSERNDLKQFGIGTMDTLNFALNSIGEFIMIDRSQLQAVMKEHALQQSGLTDDKQAVKLGKLLGAQVLVLGSIQAFDNKYRIVARFTDVETGVIVGISQVTGTDIFELQDKLANEIIQNQKVNLTEAKKQRITDITQATSDLKAYDYYIKGNTAKLRFSRSGFEEASQNFDKALEADPGYTLAIIAKLETQALWAFDLIQGGEDNKKIILQVEETLNTLLKQNKNTAESYRALCLVKLLQNKNKEALEYAKKAINLMPNDAETNFLLWISGIDENGNAMTIEPDDPLIKKALTLNPYMVFALTVRGLSYISRMKFNEAKNDFQNAIKYSPDSYLAHAGLGMIFMIENKMTDALNEMKEAYRLNPQHKNTINNLAGIYLNLERYEEATEFYNKAILVQPPLPSEDNSSYLNLGKICFQKGDYDKALDYFNKILANKPVEKLYIMATFNIAKTYRSKNNLQIAEEKYNEILSFKTKIMNDKNQKKFFVDLFSRLYYQLAEIKKVKNNITIAIQYYLECLKIDPENEDSKKALFDIYSDSGLSNYKNAKFKDAIYYFLEALKLMPKSAGTYNNLGIAQYSAGNFDDAIKAYKNAISIEPKNATAYNNIGLVYERTGKMNEAVLQYKKACELGMKETCDWLKENRY